MNYLEERQMRCSEVARYAAGLKVERLRPVGGRIRDTTAEKRQQAEHRIAQLEDYCERVGL